MRSEYRDEGAQTQISYGKSKLKDAVLELFGKRTYTQAAGKHFVEDEDDEDYASLKQKLKIQKRCNRIVRDELSEARQDIDRMDTVIHDAWDDRKDAIRKFKVSKRRLRKHRAQSVDQFKEYHRMRDELAEFHSNEQGYVRKAAFTALEQEY